MTTSATHPRRRAGWRFVVIALAATTLSIAALAGAIGVRPEVRTVEYPGALIGLDRVDGVLDASAVARMPIVATATAGAQYVSHPDASVSDDPLGPFVLHWVWPNVHDEIARIVAVDAPSLGLPRIPLDVPWYYRVEGTTLRPFLRHDAAAHRYVIDHAPTQQLVFRERHAPSRVEAIPLTASRRARYRGSRATAVLAALMALAWLVANMARRARWRVGAWRSGRLESSGAIWFDDGGPMAQMASTDTRPAGPVLVRDADGSPASAFRGARRVDPRDVLMGTHESLETALRSRRDRAGWIALGLAWLAIVQLALAHAV